MSTVLSSRIKCVAMTSQIEFCTHIATIHVSSIYVMSMRNARSVGEHNVSNVLIEQHHI